MLPAEAPASRRDWSPFNGAFLVDAIDRLHGEYVDRAVEALAQAAGGSWGSQPDRENFKRLHGGKWWPALGPAIGMISRRRSIIADLPPGRDSNWVERYAVLRNAFAPLLLELQVGRILVEAVRDHTAGLFQPVILPTGFWCAEDWVLYRRSSHDPAASQLVVFNSAGDQLLPSYYNALLNVRRRTSAARAGAMAQAVPVSTAKRTDPRVKAAEMVRGLGVALQRGSIRPGMMLTALHVAMLDALGFPRDKIPRGFDYDAFRKHCRPWLIEHGFLR